MKPNLDQSQIDFIEKKVEELGTMEGVKRHYKFYKDRKCQVDRYAIKHAEHIDLPKASKKVLKRRR